MSPAPTPFIFVADDVALDFANTLAAPTGTLFDFLGAPGSLTAWAQASGALPALGALLVAAAAHGELAEVEDEARALRDWLVCVLPQIRAGSAPLAAVDLAPLNRALTAACCAWSVHACEGRATLARDWCYAGPLSALAPLAEAIASLLARPDLHDIRKCENPQCTLWFRDVTKRGHRRWCSTAVCGNRAKVAAFRDRQKRATRETDGDG